MKSKYGDVIEHGHRGDLWSVVMWHHTGVSAGFLLPALRVHEASLTVIAEFLLQQHLPEVSMRVLFLFLLAPVFLG